jgi:hypothetical protein
MPFFIRGHPAVILKLKIVHKDNIRLKFFQYLLKSLKNANLTVYIIRERKGKRQADDTDSMRIYIVFFCRAHPPHTLYKTVVCGNQTYPMAVCRLVFNDIIFLIIKPFCISANQTDMCNIHNFLAPFP